MFLGERQLNKIQRMQYNEIINDANNNGNCNVVPIITYAKSNGKKLCGLLPLVSAV